MSAGHCGSGEAREDGPRGAEGWGREANYFTLRCRRGSVGRGDWLLDTDWAVIATLNGTACQLTRYRSQWLSIHNLTAS